MYRRCVGSCYVRSQTSLVLGTMAALAPAQLSRLRTATVRPTSDIFLTTCVQRIGDKLRAKAVRCAGGACAPESPQAAPGAPAVPHGSNMLGHGDYAVGLHFEKRSVQACCGQLGLLYRGWPFRFGNATAVKGEQYEPCTRCSATIDNIYLVGCRLRWIPYSYHSSTLV